MNQLELFRKVIFVAFLAMLFVITPNLSQAQESDSTEVKKEYPYILPILGKKAFEKGFTLPKPIGLNVGTIFNKQGLVLENFEMAIADPDQVLPDSVYKDLNGILDFGPSVGRINTLNFRADAWILPFLSVAGYYGKIWGEQTISFSVVGSDFFESTTEIVGQYYGLDILAVVPVGPVVLSGDFAWTWTTNKNLDDPVLVKVSGIRLIMPIKTKIPNRSFAFWGGAQYQKLENRTSGNIGFDEALNISEEDKQNLDNHWNSYTNNEIPNGQGEYWDDYRAYEQRAQQALYELVRGIADDNVYYKFDKRLEHKWMMLLGFNYQHNAHWQARAEYGFLKSKQQLMVMATYRFGF